jgi:hypothetical protein
VVGTTTPKEFFEALWGGVGAGFIELRPLVKGGQPSGDRAWFAWPGELDAFLAKALPIKTNVYFGVGLRKGRGKGKAEDVGALTAVWVDIDYKVTPKEKVFETLKGFPVRPSMAVESGGGVHVYWLLREPLFESSFEGIEETNRRIVATLGGDPQSCDRARILRVPGTENTKYTPPRPVSIIVFRRPELPRYTLSDFDFLPPIKAQEHEKPSAPTEVPSIELAQDKRDKIVEHLKSLWTSGWRHEMALDVSGALAHMGIAESSAREIVRAVSDAVGGETEGRLRDVVDTYKRMAEGKEIKGFAKLEERIEAEFVGDLKEGAKKALAAIKKLLPKKRKVRDFTIEKIVKFDSRPARWKIEMKSAEQPFSVEVDSKQLSSSKLFKEAAIDQANFVMPLSQPAWDDLVGSVMGKVEVREAPREATSSGAIESALEEFLKDRKERPTMGDLKNFAGADEGDVFFRVDAFKAFTRDSGIRVDNQFYDLLVHSGWRNKAKRFGSGEKDVMKVWVKQLNGSQGGNGQTTPFQEKPPI